ncbi:MAG: divergent polysaccharide deacetylase family protein [Candidatus Omnitrophota bacterium]
MNYKLKLIIAGSIIVFFYWMVINPLVISKKTIQIELIVNEVLAEFNIRPSDLLKETHSFKKIKFRRIETINKTYGVPSTFNFDSFCSLLSKRLRKRGLNLLLWEKDIKEKTYRIEVGFKNVKLYILIIKIIKKGAKVTVPPYKRARVAIVIDDFGYNIRDIDAWLNFDKPITFSILPNLPYSTYIANLANGRGKEVILHLPLEPKNEEKYLQEKFTITTSMSQKNILKILENAFKSVPGIKGVSNHQGSLATEDRRVMEIILKEIKKRNFYFLDSLVTDKSVCREVASALNLNFAQRDVFLDNIEDVEYIKGQMDKLADIAQRKGFAIGIGHVHVETLEALKENCGALEERGIEFVYLSELVE